MALRKKMRAKESAMTADLLWVGQGQIAAGVNLVGINVIAHDDDLAGDFAVHKSILPFQSHRKSLGSVMQPFTMLAATVAGLARYISASVEPIRPGKLRLVMRPATFRFST